MFERFQRWRERRMGRARVDRLIDAEIRKIESWLEKAFLAVQEAEADLKASMDPDIIADLEGDPPDLERSLDWADRLLSRLAQLEKRRAERHDWHARWVKYAAAGGVGLGVINFVLGMLGIL